MTNIDGRLTRRQQQALADLHKRGHLFLTGRGRWRARGTGHPPYSTATLNALVILGYARWDDRPGSAANWPKIVIDA